MKYKIVSKKKFNIHKEINLTFISIILFLFIKIKFYAYTFMVINMKYYLVGIKGSAMASLAKLLLDLGHDVTGVDYKEDYYTLDSKALGIKVDTFNEVNLNNDCFYIIGNAFANHSLTKYIINNYDKYEYYPKFIDKLFNLPKVAISGSHGKTTTTKLVASLSNETCNYIVGDGSGGGNQLAKFFVFEACEYKETFLNYYPQILVITNIDFDHPDYYDSVDDVFDSFNKMAQQSEMIIYNGDDKYCQKLDVYNKISFGFNKDNDLYCEYKLKENGYDLSLFYNKNNVNFFLPFLGEHMIYDFLAAYAVLHLQGLSDEVIQRRLFNFELPKRRLQTYLHNTNAVICDYAHHPAEIKAVYNTLCLQFKDNKKIIIFEPHTNTRTITFKKEFKDILELFDEVYLSHIFSSVREIIDISSEKYIYDFMNFPMYTDNIKDKLLNLENTVICFIGAGNIDLKFNQFILELEKM